MWNAQRRQRSVMAAKHKNALALLCVVALFFISSYAQGEQDCESGLLPLEGPAPPSDLEAFVWVNSGFYQSFTRNEEAAKERLRADFLCHKAIDRRLDTSFSALIPIRETDFGTACSIPLEASCNLLFNCPAGGRVRMGRRLTQCMPLFGCALSTVLTKTAFEGPVDGVGVPFPESRKTKDPTTSVGICFRGSCTILGVEDLSYAIGALAYTLCPEVYVNTTVDGWSPLHWMANIAKPNRGFGGFKVATEALIKSGANLEARDPQGFTPLHLACELGSFTTLGTLINAGADIEAKDNFGNTPLAVASYFGNTSEARKLLEAGANPHVRYFGAPGNTTLAGGNFKSPLHFAALYGMGPIEELIDAGADLDAVDGDGNTPLDIAKRFKRVRTISILEEALQ